MKKYFFVFFIALVQVKIFSIPLPEITAHDTKTKINEILQYHANYYDIYTNPAKQKELIKKTLNNYLCEIDPTFSYFIYSEIEQWVNPSDALLEETLDFYTKEKFPLFQEIFRAMQKAIVRKQGLEEKISHQSIVPDVDFPEFHSSWVNSIDELENKILKIKSFRTKTAQTFCDDETRELFFQRVQKQSRLKENAFIQGSLVEQERLSFSLILKSISSALDSNTKYFMPHEANQFKVHTEQKLFGIGVQIRDDINGFTIIDIIKNTPVHKHTEIQTGDKIIGIDRKPIVELDIFEIVELIRGPKNTPITLTLLKKNNETIDVVVIRDEVILESEQVEIKKEPFGDGIIGIVKLSSFYENQKKSSYSELKKQLIELKKNTLKGIIFDTRDNPGGLLSQAVAITSLFIKNGVVVSVKNNTGSIRKYRNIESNPVWTGPLIILTNKESASAAELVTQTLQEYGVAIVVGDTATYGKGTFQTFSFENNNNKEINPKGEFKVTRGRYYTVSGKSPQLIGVCPNIIIPGTLSELKIGERFAKYPLESDSIPPSFEENLNEIPIYERDEIPKNYNQNLQPVVRKYQPFLQTLQKNSEFRLTHNKNYQLFYKMLKEKKSPLPIFYEQKDLQLYEAINVMKDLLVLHHNP